MFYLKILFGEFVVSSGIEKFFEVQWWNDLACVRFDRACLLAFGLLKSAIFFSGTLLHNFLNKVEKVLIVDLIRIILPNNN